MTSTFVYGPVPSRRLGRSLGVDIVPFKICTYDCIYCQLGQTTQRTVHRAFFAPIDEVLREVQETLERVPRPDYVTISGCGEPTLHQGIGEIVAGIKTLTEVPVAIVTNGCLLFRQEVREACGTADVVIPSLDAGDDVSFRLVNRPHQSLSFEQVVQGLVEFRQEYNKTIWLEVLLLGGVTGTPAEALKIKKHVDRIRPDRIQLNTVVRPAAEDLARPVPPDELERLRKLFGKRAEVIAPYAPSHQAKELDANRDDILALVSRRPCSIEDLANGLMRNKHELLKCVNELVARGLIKHTDRNGHLYFVKNQR